MLRAQSIHRRISEVSDDRGAFLWGIFTQHGGKRTGGSGFYLDVGTGNSANLEFFMNMMRCEFAVGIDVSRDLSKRKGAMLLRADAQNLPFRDGSFDLITLFSLIEHVPRPDVCLSESIRTLRSDGQLFFQLPNRYFPIELHSGLPLYFYLPKRIRDWLAVTAGLSGMTKIDVPSLRRVRKMLKMIQPSLQLVAVGFYYPEGYLPDSRVLKFFHWIMRRLHIFRILPMGYVGFVSCQTQA